MKRIVIMFLISFCILLIGCSSSTNKILNNIELNKTPQKELIKNLNLEAEDYEIWDEEKGIYNFVYVWHYANYTLNNVDGVIRIRFEDETAEFVNYSAEATSENMEQLLSYLIDTYGEKYEDVQKIDDDDKYITRWTQDNLIIDYALTNEDTIEVRWYNAE